MQLSEISKAIAIIPTPNRQNLNEYKLVSCDKIVDGCMSLVRRTRASERLGDDDLLRLSHSSARAYLTDNTDIPGPLPETPLVDSRIIRKCCLRYLRQPRYSQLLTKQTGGAFYTSHGERVASHSLLSYADKS